jgi:hypothetical protein
MRNQGQELEGMMAVHPCPSVSLLSLLYSVLPFFKIAIHSTFIYLGGAARVPPCRGGPGSGKNVAQGIHGREARLQSLVFPCPPP